MTDGNLRWGPPRDILSDLEAAAHAVATTYTGPRPCHGCGAFGGPCDIDCPQAAAPLCPACNHLCNWEHSHYRCSHCHLLVLTCCDGGAQ